MERIKKYVNYFSKTEIALWSLSVTLIAVSFAAFGRTDYFTLAASLIGVTSLIFCAKGNPAGQVMMIVFGVFYGIISYGFRYYGEMITYLGMSAPMAVFALISWLKNPYRGDKSQVKVNKISRRETVFMLVLSAMVTAVFWFILKKLGTANLVPSTVSVTTSFIAVYLTFRRSAYYALGYALNDLILIVLWIMAATVDINYISMVICFLVFLANDVYGFFSWLKMQKRQAAESEQQVSE